MSRVNAATRYSATVTSLLWHLDRVCESAANWGSVLEETEGVNNVANARVAAARRYTEEVRNELHLQ
jgi:hypothetical protein